MKLFVCLCWLVLAAYVPCRAQQSEIERLFLEGMALQDKGDAAGALKIFDQVLQKDPDHIPALSEKTYSLMALNRYRPVLDLTAKVLAKHKGSKKLLFIYINRGNAFAYLGKTNEALKTFDEGLAAFPTANLLYFNKGLTLAETGRNKEARYCFEQAILNDPEEPSPHLALGHLALSQQQRLPAILAFSRFLVLEPEGKRAKHTLKQLRELLANPLPKPGNADTASASFGDFRKVEQAFAKSVENKTTTAKQTAGNAKTAKTPSAAKKPATAKKAPAVTEKPKTEAEKLQQTYTALINGLRQEAPSGSGFFWTYYVPYLIEMQDLNLVAPFVNVIMVSEGEKNNDAWINANTNEINRFFGWSEIFPWKKSS